MAGSTKVAIGCLTRLCASRAWHQRTFIPSLVNATGYCRSLCTVTETVEKAKERLNILTKDPGNEAKLKLYGLYKQATNGQCNTSKPGAFDFVGRAKWNAWNSLGDMSKETASQQYSQYVDELVGSQPADPVTPSNSPSDTNEDIIVTTVGSVRVLTLNRPSKYNATTVDMYGDIIKVMKEAGADDSVRALVLTGKGKYYTSGNDLSNFLGGIDKFTPQELSARGKRTLLEYIDTYIDFPKPLVAAVNGHSVGLGVSTLGLCDLVYCTESATFHTPFVKLGQAPEACSSYLFPKIMGYGKANELLMMGHKFTSSDAYSAGLVTRVFADDEFDAKIKEVIDHLNSLPPQSLMKTKQLIRGNETELLKQVNQRECELLEERWTSEECINAVMAFTQKRKN